MLFAEARFEGCGTDTAFDDYERVVGYDESWNLPDAPIMRTFIVSTKI